MNRIICWTCFTLAISVLQFALLQRRSEFNQNQEKNDSQQKSRPMMNLTARMSSVVSSSTSWNPVKTWNGHQNPVKSVVVDDRSGQLDKLSPAGYSKLDYGHFWSSQEWRGVRLRRTIGQGNLMKLLRMMCYKFVIIMKMLFFRRKCVIRKIRRDDS